MPGRNDYIYGSIGNNTIYALDGDDVIDATQGGNDTLDGGSGNDFIYAGSGANLIVGGSDADIIQGGITGDVIFGDNRIDDISLYIKSSASTESVNEKGDFIAGDDGDDILVSGVKNDTIEGGEGNDLIISGAGDDYILADSNSIAVDFNYSWTNPNGPTVPYGEYILSNANLIGPEGSGNDIVYSGSGNDHVWLGNGNDTVYAGNGNDVLQAEGGDDIVFGENGNDYIDGDSYWNKQSEHGKDYLDGGAGNDIITGYGNADILYGGEGDDILKGDANVVEGYYSASADGNDYLDGGSGNDTLYGGGKDDYLIGGDGDDIINGDDVICHNLSAEFHGNDHVFAGNGNDKVWGDGGDDVIYGGDGDDYLDGDDVSIDGIYHGKDIIYGGNGNDTIIANGSDDIVYGGDGNDIISGDAGNIYLPYHGNDVLYGENGDDTIVGCGGDDVLSGGKGVDILQGDTGGDVYLFELGDSVPYVNGLEIKCESILDIEGNNVIKFGIGISVTDIKFKHDTNSSSLIVSYSSSDTFVINNAFTSSFSLEFYDGYKSDLNSLIQASLQGTENSDNQLGYDSDDTMSGFGGDDILDSGKGNDTLDGGSGNDKLDGGDGNDRLYGGSGDDILTGGAGDDVLYGYGSDSYHRGYDKTPWGKDGVDIIHGGSGNDSLRGDEGNDFLYGDEDDDNLDGGYGNDILVGGQGHDILRGQNGSDTYIFSRGFGQDIIYNRSESGVITNENDIIKFIDLNLSDILLRKDGDDLVIYVNGTNDSIRVSEHFLSIAKPCRTGAEISGIMFSDGTYISESNINKLAMAEVINTEGTPLNETIAGDERDNIITGGAGDDFLVGGLGNDTLCGDVLFKTIKVNGYASLASNIGAEMQLWINGCQVATTIVDSTIAKDYSFNVAIVAGKINKLDIVFANDAFIKGQDRNLIINNVTVGDYIMKPTDIGVTLDKGIGMAAFDGVQVFAGQKALNWNGSLRFNIPLSVVGMAGNDILSGESGSDTYKFGIGYGQDIIDNWDENSLGDNPDRILFNQDITPDRLCLRRATDDLSISIIGTKDTLTVKNYFLYDVGSLYPVETLEFSNSTVWNMDTIKLKVMEGTAFDDILQGYASNDIINAGDGNDQVWGNDGDDLLSGGAGSDILIGGFGNDTYFINPTDGNDIIIDQDITAGNAELINVDGGNEVITDQDTTVGDTDLIQFGENINADQLWFTQSGNNLDINVFGTTDKITIQNWYADIAYHIEQIKTFDGKTLLDSQVANLVSVMSSLTPPGAGQTTLPQNYQEQLSAVLAANWK